MSKVDGIAEDAAIINDINEARVLRSRLREAVSGTSNDVVVLAALRLVHDEVARTSGKHGIGLAGVIEYFEDYRGSMKHGESEY